MRSLQKFQAAWLAHSFLRELVLVYPVYAIMMGESGVSPLELSTLFMAWSGSVILLEIPTGSLADRFNRKHLLLLSLAIKGLCFLTWLAFPSFWGFLAGFLIWGTGSSLGSGTREALLHDALAVHGREDEFVKLYGRAAAAENFGVATALTLGGLVAATGYTAPLLLSTCAPWLAAGVIATGIDEPPRSGRATSPGSSALATIAAGAREIRGNRVLLVMLVMTATLFVYGIVDEYIGPLLNATGAFPIYAIGFVYASCFLARTGGAAFAHRLPISSLRGIAAIVGAASLLMLAGLWSTATILAAALIVYFGSSAAAEVLLQGRLQNAIEGRSRATITSMTSMGQEITSVGLYFFVGVSAELLGWAGGMAIVVGLSAIAALCFVSSGFVSSSSKQHR